MNGLLLVLICGAIGIVLKKSDRLPQGSGSVLNAYVISVSLPALVLLQIHKMAFENALTTSVWIPISMGWIQFAIAAVFYQVFRRLFKFTVPTSGALLLTIGLGNTSFVGFPLLEAIFGSDALKTGVLVDQPGSFLVLSTLGVFSAAILSEASLSKSHSHQIRAIFKRICTFPPFLAMVAGAVFYAVPFSPLLSSVLDRVAATLVPVALVALGFQLDLSIAKIRARLIPLVFGLSAKLLIVPVLMSILYLKIVPDQGRVSQIIILESAMAPMITGGILASDSGLDPELASLMVGVGIPLSLITVPIWAKVLGVF